MEHTLTTGNVWKKMIGFAIPIFGANLLQALYGTVDLMIVGWFSDAALRWILHRSNHLN